ncbi:MAG: hypothetical protein E7472_07800 [Ruminococcaceae bacterium]|nr:hypothetical protein [Oscillospiraceae bacterium]
MLTMELLLREIRDRIVFMRVDGITMPTNHNALLFDAEEPFLDQYYYVGDWRDLPSLAPEGCDGSCFFCAGGESLAHDAQPDISYRNLVVFSGSVVYLHNYITKKLRAYDDWMNLLRSTEDLQTLTKLTAEKAGHPIAIVNSFFQRVTLENGGQTFREVFEELAETNKMTYERAREMLYREKVMQHTDRIFFTYGDVRVADQVIRQGDRTAARVLMECPQDEDEGYVLAFLDDLTRTIKPRVLTDQSLRQYFTDAVSILIGDIIDQKITDPDEIEQRRRLSPDMVMGEQYHPVVIKFQKQSQRVPFNYISGHLKEIFPRSSVAIYNNGMVVLAAKNDYYDEVEFDRKHLMELLEQFDGYAGIGNCTKFLTSLRSLYIQAAAATRLGRVFSQDKSERIFYYKDYNMYFMVDLCVETAVRFHKFGNISYLCQPGLMGLIRYDRKFGTQLYDTLRVYLECNCNATLCAQKLNVHRNTVNYRINMIEELCNYSLDDVMTRMNISFSYMILDYEQLFLGVDPVSTLGKMTMQTDWDMFISMSDKQ